MKFKDLWYNHPANNDDINPCWSDKSNFENQCAIRMGVALQRSGVAIKHYRGVTCTTDFNFTPECKEFHPLRVNELQDFLEVWLGEPESYINCTYEDFVEKKGIIIFLDFWGTNMQGDHVDLWDGQSMTYGAKDYFERSREILFWDME
jgi:hypothetical protein